MSKSPTVCVVPRIANPPSGKVALGEPWKKTWMAIAQNRLPFGFHIHIIDLWIFYTVFTTPPQRLYLHFWSTFQFALHKHKRLAGLMKFHFKTAFCLLCHDVCEFSFTDIISPDCRATQFQAKQAAYIEQFQNAVNVIYAFFYSFFLYI